LSAGGFFLVSVEALAVLSVCFVLFVVLRLHEVDNSVTEEDKRYIAKFLRSEKAGAPSGKMSYEEEIDYIVRVQKAVLGTAAGQAGIPFDKPREPKQLYRAKSGLCYDRSRAIEKILRAAGFETRHISIFSTHKTDSALKSLITPGVASHAVTEVLTSNGWLVVDSNHLWVSLDQQGSPVSIEQLHAVGAFDISWKKPISMKGRLSSATAFIRGMAASILPTPLCLMSIMAS
jgi:Transglutaminase-like superfamily